MAGTTHFHSDWLLPDWPAPAGVRAVCTTRAGGLSLPPYDSLNLGLHVGDTVQAVAHNRRVLGQALGVAPVWMTQVHGTALLQLNGQPQVLAATTNAGDALATPAALTAPIADGAWTLDAGLVCTVMVADCLPVLLCSTDGTWVAAAHAGWRGLAGEGGAGILESIFRSFSPGASVEQALAAPELIAWLGPCIGPQAFEVGAEVCTAFLQALVDPLQIAAVLDCFVPVGQGKFLADLPGLARLRLAALGVTRVFGNDGRPPWCTVGNPSRFFSHRRDRVSGRLAACIWRG